PHIRFLFVGSRLCSTLPSDGPSRFRPCALLVLHLHQVAQGTFTPKLSDMSDTQAAARRLRRWPAARLDRHCARCSCGSQVGTKGWSRSIEQRDELGGNAALRLGRRASRQRNPRRYATSHAGHAAICASARRSLAAGSCHGRPAARQSLPLAGNRGRRPPGSTAPRSAPDRNKASRRRLLPRLESRGRRARLVPEVSARTSSPAWATHWRAVIGGNPDSSPITSTAALTAKPGTRSVRATNRASSGSLSVCATAAATSSSISAWLCAIC